MLNVLLTVGIIILVIVNQTMPIEAKTVYKYAKTTVNIRAAPKIKSKKVGQVYWNDRIKVIRKVNKRWYMIRYKGRNRYVCGKYLKTYQNKYKSYLSPSSCTFKSYEDAACITNNSSIPQGKLKQKYHLDYKSGVYMVENRYCIAVGSYYTKKIGTRIDLVLSHNGKTHILKCITADMKADKDTVNKHRIHKDGSVVEFVVKTSELTSKARIRGDVSYTRKKFKGKIVKINVY